MDYHQNKLAQCLTLEQLKDEQVCLKCKKPSGAGGPVSGAGGGFRSITSPSCVHCGRHTICYTFATKLAKFGNWGSIVVVPATLIRLLYAGHAMMYLNVVVQHCIPFAFVLYAFFNGSIKCWRAKPVLEEMALKNAEEKVKIEADIKRMKEKLNG
mgnify:FL=1